MVNLKLHLHMIQSMLSEDVFDPSCSTLLFELRTYCVTFGERAFSSYAPKIWNKLPAYIKNSQFETFKVLLKSHLFQEAYK